MGKYQVIISPRFQKEFSKLTREIQGEAKKKLTMLETRPYCGTRLKHKLSDFWSIHFHKNKYRIIYTIEEKKVKVLALAIGKRTDDFYKKVEKEVKELKKRKSELRQGYTLSLSNLF